MARKKGDFIFASNFEVNGQAPLDARLVVNNKSELIDLNTWSHDGDNYYIYRGMQVSSLADSKVYMYIGKDTTPSSIKKLANWKDITSSSTSNNIIDLGNLGDNILAIRNLTPGIYIGYTEDNIDFGVTEATGAKVLINGAKSLQYVRIEVKNMSYIDSIESLGAYFIQRIYTSEGNDITRIITNNEYGIEERTISDTLADFKYIIENGIISDGILTEDNKNMISENKNNYIKQETNK